jgi:hypothetical protein
MVEGTEQYMPYAEPVVWIVLEGQGQVFWKGGREPLSFAKGSVVLLPAHLPEGRVRITAATRWLEVTVPVASDLAGYEHPAPEGLQSERPGGPVQIGLPPRRSE